MRYVTDANVSGLAKELRGKGIDCQTIHMLMKGTEDSRIQIRDPEIVKFLKEKKGTITLITLDSELSEYCAIDGIPCIRIQDLVAEHIGRTKAV